LILSRYDAFILPPLPVPVNHVLHCTISPCDSNILAEAICSYSALGISDGSYMPTHYPGWASAAWFLSDSSAAQSTAFMVFPLWVDQLLRLMLIVWNYMVYILFWWPWNFFANRNESRYYYWL